MSEPIKEGEAEVTTLDDLWAEYDRQREAATYDPTWPVTARHAIEEAIRAEAGGDGRAEGVDYARAEAGGELLARLKDAEERAAHWQGNHKQQVELKRKSHEMVLALREALLTAARSCHGPHHAGPFPPCSLGNCPDARAVLADTAPAAAAEVARIEKPWRKALTDARNLIAEWGAYASDYFQEKWGLADDLARIDALLDKSSEGEA